MEYDLSYDDSPSLKQTLADLLRGMSKKQAYQELGQGIQNTAKVIPSVVESLGRGAVAQVPGTFGDISELARQFAPETMQSVMGNRVAPTTEEILAKIPRLNPDYQGSGQHETIGGLISPAMPSLLRAGAKATQNMPIGNMIAYHGTPHEIKGGFDISKVGTGEGNQSYGYGMYFAENPQVAKQYLANAESQKTPEGNAISYIANYGSYKKALEGAKNRLNFMENHSPEQVNFQKETIKALETKNLGGNLYKVDIPDKDIPNMLDWDKPISQQSNSVQNVAKELLIKIKKISPDADLSNMNGQQLYRLYQQYRGNNPDFASEGMNELGIKGIRYLDQGSRDKGGTSNFVIFDPKEVKILEKNNKPVTRKNILEQTFEGTMPHYKNYENLSSVFEKAGLKVKETGSSKSNSKYVEIEDPISGIIVTARFANHPQSGQAMTLHGPADIEIGDIFKHKSWQDAVNPILDRINKFRKEFGDEPLILNKIKK